MLNARAPNIFSVSELMLHAQIIFSWISYEENV